MGANNSKSNAVEPMVCTEECEDIASSLADQVLSGDRKLIDPVTQGGTRVMQPARLTDTLRPLKGVATDLIVAEFFATAGPLITFLKLVHTMYQRALSTFRRRTGISKAQLFFIFKGGNILRIAAHDFLSSLPALAKKEIEDFYSPFFKRSDNDFGIYLSPFVPDYELRFDQITTLSYHLQDQIRSIITHDFPSYFDYSRYNSEFKAKVLKAWLPKFSEVSDTQYDKIEIASVPADLSMKFTRDDRGASAREVSILELQQYPSSLKITHNNALDFGSDQDDSQRSTFNLTRTKIHFMLTSSITGESQRVTGELLDVSMGYRTDTVTQDMFRRTDGAISKYHLNHQESGLELDFESYSLHHIGKDLEGILFRQFGSYPWNDSKYAKRLNRLMYVYFIDIFIKRENNVDRLKVLNDLESFVAGPVIKGGSVKIDVAGFQRQHSDLSCVQLVYRMNVLARKVQENADESTSFVQMGEVIRQNLTFQMNTLAKVKEYCTTDGKLMESDVYTGNIKTFV